MQGIGRRFEPIDLDTFARTQARILRRARALPPDKLETLAREVIRRLASQQTSSTSKTRGPTHADIHGLCQALIDPDNTAAANHVTRLRAMGVSAEDIYLDYLAPAARQLGEWWNEDRTPFWKVTVGTGRLLAIMRTMSPEFDPGEAITTKSATFASVPGEEHVLGLHMAADIFRKDGWDITLLVGHDHDKLVSEIQDTGNVLIGLSMSGEKALDALAKLVLAIRVLQPSARIFVSGPQIADIRTRLLALDLDGIAVDVDDAREQMSRFLNRN